MLLAVFLHTVPSLLFITVKAGAMSSASESLNCSFVSLCHIVTSAILFLGINLKVRGVANTS